MCISMASMKSFASISLERNVSRLETRAIVHTNKHEKVTYSYTFSLLSVGGIIGKLYLFTYLSGQCEH